MHRTNRKYGSDVPGARDRLENTASRLERGVITPEEAAREIRVISAEDLHQRPPKRIKDKNPMPPLTKEKRDKAFELYMFTDMTQLEIANELGTNPGRISEALNGW